MITRSTYGSFQQVSVLMQQAAADLQTSQLDAMGLDRLRRPSEHPADASQAVQLDAELAAHQALVDRLGTINSQMTAADGALGEAASLLSSVIEIAVAMATESYGEIDRAAAAGDLDETIAAMVGLGNTEFGGVYLFAGTAYTEEPFADDGTYQGASTAREIPLLGSDTLTVGTTGDEIFNAAGVGVFDAVTTLQDALTVNDVEAVQGSLDTLSLAYDHLVEQRASYGMAQVRVEDLARVSEEATLSLEGFLGSLKELDPIEAFSRLAEAQTVYQAAATTLSQVLQTNIFQYI